MRGVFGRSRMEKPQPGVAINSYEEALYPPRAYRYHVQHQTFPPPSSRQQPTKQQPPTIVLPSIDADSTCEPHARVGQVGAFAGGAAAGAVAQSVEKKPPPALREYFGCYAPLPSASSPRAPLEDPLQSTTRTRLEEEACQVLFSTLARYAQFEGKGSGWIEPLNIFHYPQLLVSGAVPSSPSSAAKTAAPHAPLMEETRVRHAVASLADRLGLPQELRTFTGPVSHPASGAVTLTAKTEARLRIRAAPRQRPARVMRRGAKVAIIAAAQPAPGFTGHHGGAPLGALRKRPRGAGGPGVAVLHLLHDEDDDGHPSSKRARGEEDGEANGARGGGVNRNGNRNPTSGSGHATVNAHHGGDGWDDADGEAEDTEDDDELSVDLYDAADDDDQADVDDMGGDDDGGDYM